MLGSLRAGGGRDDSDTEPIQRGLNFEFKASGGVDANASSNSSLAK